MNSRMALEAALGASFNPNKDLESELNRRNAAKDENPNHDPSSGQFASGGGSGGGGKQRASGAPPKHGTPEYMAKAKAYYKSHENPGVYSAFRQGQKGSKREDNPFTAGGEHHKAWETGRLAAGGKP